MTWLHVRDEGSVRLLTIDRPERRNAIPFDGFPELTAAFVEFEKSNQRVLILTGAGGSFCAGADLDPTARDSLVTVTDRHRRMKVVEGAAMALHRLTKPSIAAVDGYAVGAGMNLAIGCDVVLAADTAKFSEIFVKRGLTVDFGGTWLLPRIVGLQRAKELALSGRVVGADEALALGLALEVVPRETLLDRAAEIAQGFLAGAPLAQMFAKEALNASFELSFSDAVSWEGQSQAIALSTEDSQEGVKAFLERRDPEWQGR